MAKWQSGKAYCIRMQLHCPAAKAQVQHSSCGESADARCCAAALGNRSADCAPLAQVRLGEFGIEIQGLARILNRLKEVFQLQTRLRTVCVELWVLRIGCKCLRRPSTA